MSRLARIVVPGVPHHVTQRANRFLPKWAKRNGLDPKGQEVKQWFRNDPRVKKLITRQGKLGLGPEADKNFLSEE